MYKLDIRTLRWIRNIRTFHIDAVSEYVIWHMFPFLNRLRSAPHYVLCVFSDVMRSGSNLVDVLPVTGIHLWGTKITYVHTDKICRLGRPFYKPSTKNTTNAEEYDNSLYDTVYRNDLPCTANEELTKKKTMKNWHLLSRDCHDDTLYKMLLLVQRQVYAQEDWAHNLRQTWFIFVSPWF